MRKQVIKVVNTTIDNMGILMSGDKKGFQDFSKAAIKRDLAKYKKEQMAKKMGKKMKNSLSETEYEARKKGYTSRGKNIPLRYNVHKDGQNWWDGEHKNINSDSTINHKKHR